MARRGRWRAADAAPALHAPASSNGSEFILGIGSSSDTGDAGDGFLISR
jgi:hypothetical protein